jgi:hypothetical protein
MAIFIICHAYKFISSRFKIKITANRQHFPTGMQKNTMFPWQSYFGAPKDTDTAVWEIEKYRSSRYFCPCQWRDKCFHLSGVRWTNSVSWLYPAGLVDNEMCHVE